MTLTPYTRLKLVDAICKHKHITVTECYNLLDDCADYIQNDDIDHVMKILGIRKNDIIVNILKGHKIFGD